MKDIEKIDDELYGSIYGKPLVGDCKEIWFKIKDDSNILREAVKIKRNKWNQKDTVKGLAICDAMLCDYENIDQVAYKELINIVYTNTDIARIVINGASNGGYSYLLMSLWNHDLKLSKEQKEFAVKEAMNKIGTVKWEEESEEYSKKLDVLRVDDDKITIMDIDKSKNPVGTKSGAEYMRFMFNLLSTEQAHGTGAFDIRYTILNNPNWTIEEKQQLIMGFWFNDEEYEECLEEWEWAIINDKSNYKGNLMPLLDKEDLYNYSYENLLEFYEDKKTADKIWQEIKFCSQMHKLRPQQHELEQFKPTKKLNYSKN